MNQLIYDLAKIALAYSQNPASFVIFCIAAVITVILVLALTLSVLAFILAQVANIFSLYTSFTTEDISKFHPYTRSILQNKCPEFKRIQQLKSLPKTNYTRQELRQVVQSIIDTLEEYETQPVKHKIIQQLKGI